MSIAVTSMVFGEQVLRHDLPEAAEADHQHRALRAVEIVGLAFGRAREAAHSDSVSVANGGPISSVIAAIAESRLPCVGAEDAERGAERQQHEGEFARAGEHRARAQGVAALARR